MNRKQTAWKKNRKLGDIYGGRERLRLRDNIFRRLHSLKAPKNKSLLPILIEENPSRDFFFPISVQEAEEAMKALPKHDYQGITHIWLRRVRKKDHTKHSKPLAEFICGSGVRVIILYPWPNDMIQNFGPKKPSNKVFNEYKKYEAEPYKKDGHWVSKWELPNLRKFYINSLLYHEVGHHIDWYFRYWSKANRKQIEEFADQYAMQKATTATYVWNRLEKVRKRNSEE